MYHIRNLLNYRKVKKEPTTARNACENFFQVFIEAHIVYAAKTHFKMASLDDTPQMADLPPNFYSMPMSERKTYLYDLCKAMIKEIVSLYHHQQTRSCSSDRVYAYASDVLSLGLIYMEYNDAIKEADGNRIIRVWRYLLLIFHNTAHSNYALEALTMLVQYHYIFTPRMKQQLLWNRTINIHGKYPYGPSYGASQ